MKNCSPGNNKKRELQHCSLNLKNYNQEGFESNGGGMQDNSGRTQEDKDQNNMTAVSRKYLFHVSMSVTNKKNTERQIIH